MTIFSNSFSFCELRLLFCKNIDQCFNCCLNNCFLSEMCAREAAAPGAYGHGHRVLFESWGYLFLKQAFDFDFSQCWSQKLYQKETKINGKTKSKNEPENGCRKVRKNTKKDLRRDARTSKTKQNAQRGDDFRKMHSSAQWTTRLRKSVPKSYNNDPKMRHNALKNRPRNTSNK